jgi:hypothetical protein
MQTWLVNRVAIVCDQCVHIRGGKFGSHPVEIQKRSLYLVVAADLVEVRDQVFQAVSRGLCWVAPVFEKTPVSQPTLALLQTDMIGSSNRLILLAVPFGEPFKKRSMEEGICSITERQK